MRFVDTNIFIYSVSLKPEEAPKAAVAKAILDGGDFALSVQVLQEFYVQATRTNKLALPHDDTVALIAHWQRFPVQPMTVEVLNAALATKARFQISYWDAAIIEAARAASCDEVISEDLNHRQDYGGVRVTNPFL